MAPEEVCVVCLRAGEKSEKPVGREEIPACGDAGV